MELSTQTKVVVVETLSCQDHNLQKQQGQQLRQEQKQQPQAQLSNVVEKDGSRSLLHIFEASGQFLLIEIQGSLEIHNVETFGNQGNDEMATLEIDSENETYWLYIGHHRMEGCVVPLKKPLALLESKKQNHMESLPNQYDCSSLPQNGAINFSSENSADAFAQISGIIEKKILFNVRPEPVE